MHRLALAFLVATISLADSNQKKENKAQDMSSMSSEAHAPLFQAPQSQQAGTVTDRVTAGLPRPATPAGRAPRRNFIDEYIFGKMERDGVLHAPLALDQEFFRRVTLDLTGRIPSPDELREFLSNHIRRPRFAVGAR